MDFYWKAALWDDDHCPNAARLARPSAFKRVSAATAIKLTNASYRLAKFQGVFAMDESSAISIEKNGKCSCIVYCLWFNRRLQTRGMRISFAPEDAKILKNYSGQVVTNISL